MKENRIEAVRAALGASPRAEVRFDDWSTAIDVPDCSAPPDPGSPGDGPGDWPADFYDTDPGTDPGDGGVGGAGGDSDGDPACPGDMAEAARPAGVRPNNLVQCDDYYGGDDL